MIGPPTFPTSFILLYFTPTQIHVANHRYATIGDTPPTYLWFVLKHLMSITATIFDLFQHHYNEPYDGIFHHFITKQPST